MSKQPNGRKTDIENAQKDSCPICNGRLRMIPPDNTFEMSVSEDAKNGYAICDACGRSLGLGSNGEIVKRHWQ